MLEFGQRLEVKYNDKQLEFIDSLTEQERKAFEIAKDTFKNDECFQATDFSTRPITEIEHILDVAMACSTEDERIVAFLHDVVGQRKILPRDLNRIFKNQAVYKALVALKNDPGYYRSYMDRVKKNPLAKTVKILDYKCLLINPQGRMGDYFLRVSLEHAIHHLQDLPYKWATYKR